VSEDPGSEEGIQREEEMTGARPETGTTPHASGGTEPGGPASSEPEGGQPEEEDDETSATARDTSR
jgi:hypothetical protein